MALRITESPETTEVEEVHPDIDIYLVQNDDGSVDVVSGLSNMEIVRPTRIIRFFEDGSIARLDYEPKTLSLFWKRDAEGLVIVN